MRSLEEINQILVDDLERATREFRIAAAALRGVIDDVPSGLPAQDGSFLIEKVAKAKMRAMADLRRAIHRHSEFLFKQKIPEDLPDE